jgi:hypothetical protein
VSDIPAELSLDVTAALAAIAQIDAALSAALTVQVDVDTASLDAALAATDATVNVEADATGVTTGVDEALAAADTAVDVGVDADISRAQDAINSLEGEDVEIGVTADTSQATAALEDLGSSAEGASGGVVDIATGMRAAEGAAAGLGGNLSGVLGTVKSFGGAATTAAVGVGILATAGRTLVGAAIDSVSAMQTFNLVLGESAEAVETINVGGLNEDLADLAHTVGSDDESFRNAISALFAFGEANGSARSEVEQTTETIAALAARAVALRPSLGDVGDVVGRLTQSLATGRNLSQFALSFSSAQITAEALRETLKDSADELTRYDRVAAAATLANRQLGSSLAVDVAAGSENVALKFRRVQEDIKDTIEEAGAPLLDPVLDLLQSAEPVVEAVAEAFSAALQVVLPFANALSDILVPALEQVTPLLELAGKAGSFLGGVFKVGAELSGIPTVLRGVEFAGDRIGSVFEDGGAQAEDGAAQIAAAVDAVNTALGSIGRGLDVGSDLADAFGQVTDEVRPLTAAEAQLRAETVRLVSGLQDGTVTTQQFRAAFRGSGLDVAGFTSSIEQVIQERQRLAASFNSALPSLGDALTVEATKVATGTAKIDRSFEDLISASDKLRDQLTQGLPSIADLFTEGVSPEDLRDAQNTLEAFIQGVEGVTKSAADAAQAVIDKANLEGGQGLAGFLERLRKQTAEIQAFQATLATLRQRGALDLAGTFAERGIESAAIAAEAAGLSDTDLANAEATVEKAKTVKQEAVRNMGLFADELVATFGPKGAEAGEVFGTGLVTALASPDVLAQARAQAQKLAEATAAGAGSAQPAAGPQSQSLAGFLANLSSQSGQIEEFQRNLDKIAREGGQTLADTLREQGLDAAQAARQAAALAPTELLDAEARVREAQDVLARAEADNADAAARLQQFTADTATAARVAFEVNFAAIDLSVGLGVAGQQILDAQGLLVGNATLAGLAVGTALGDAITKGTEDALRAGALAALFGAVGGAAITLGPVALQTTPTQAGFGTGTPQPPGTTATTQPTVNIENINVTPPKDATTDEQAAAIAEQLAWTTRGKGPF